MGYKNLTREQRYTIEALLQTPISLREIREVIGVRRHYLMFTDEISLRPSIIDEKKRFGDFEIDTMIGKNRRGTIMTTNDRCTHLMLIRRLAGKEATLLASTAIEALLPYKDKIHTITADNGKGFARPFHSWERGKRKHERIDTPVHSERHGFQRADR